MIEDWDYQSLENRPLASYLNNTDQNTYAKYISP
jgi:hypothetical protein